jgi:uncharacterized delta-60 repeat protein
MTFHHNAAGGNGNDSGSSNKIQADGKIVIAGQSENSLDTDMVIWRFNTNGTLDTTFGCLSGTCNGFTVYSASSSYEDAIGLAVQTDGKLVISGYQYSLSGYFMALWRYNTNGTIDTTFGCTTGTGCLGYITEKRQTSSFDSGNKLTLQTDGKILITGSSIASNMDLIVWRYNTNGLIDTTFGCSAGTGCLGYSIFQNAEISSSQGYDIIVQTDDKILVTGYAIKQESIEMLLCRYSTNGTLDSTFNTNGFITHTVTTNPVLHIGFGLALQADNKILITGIAQESWTISQKIIWRILP